MDKNDNVKKVVTTVILQRIGMTKSVLRRWVKLGLVLKLDGVKNDLTISDSFSRESLGVRYAFISEANGNLVDLVPIFARELGSDDGLLPKLLKETSLEDLIRSIAERNNLKYNINRAKLFA